MAFEDGRTEFWVSASRKARLCTHSNAVTSVTFSPDDKRFLTTSRDGSAKVWKFPEFTGRSLSDYLEVVGSRRRCDAEDQPALTPMVGHQGAVNDGAFSPNGELIATAGTDRKVLLWDARTGAKIDEFPGHGAAVTKVMFIDDRHLASAGDDGMIKFWDVPTVEQMKETDRLLGRLIALRGKLSPGMTGRQELDGSTVNNLVDVLTDLRSLMPTK